MTRKSQISGTEAEWPACLGSSICLFSELATFRSSAHTLSISQLCSLWCRASAGGEERSHLCLSVMRSHWGGLGSSWLSQPLQGTIFKGRSKGKENRVWGSEKEQMHIYCQYLLKLPLLCVFFGDLTPLGSTCLCRRSFPPVELSCSHFCLI